jgi:Polyketide cyclase / dehydrase and lipid transport
MDDIALELECSVEADASPAFVWRFRTDITTWIDPPARFALDGPFADGAHGTTVMPEQEPFHWRIRDVRPGRSFVIEILLDRATIRVFWRFDALSVRTTKMTQRIELSGSNAGAYVNQVRDAFGATLSDGMQRIAAQMAAAEKATARDPGSTS